MNASPNGALDRKRNVRLALILATVAATLFVGFIAKTVLLSHP
jgi:hypothetical protein